VLAIFQPHRFTRTRTTHAQFAGAFRDADEVYITEIYSADEPPIPGVTAALIVDAVRRQRPVHFVASADEVVVQVAGEARAGDLILTLGAGDIHATADAIVGRLRARARVRRCARGRWSLWRTPCGSAHATSARGSPCGSTSPCVSADPPISW
jgi:UDP-N-acetylmuramate--alanine ligase